MRTKEEHKQLTLSSYMHAYTNRRARLIMSASQAYALCIVVGEEAGDEKCAFLLAVLCALKCSHIIAFAASCKLLLLCSLALFFVVVVNEKACNDAAMYKAYNVCVRNNIVCAPLDAAADSHFFRLSLRCTFIMKTFFVHILCFATR
jgi:hypothetical protein